jgi:hypothetical protein
METVKKLRNHAKQNIAKIMDYLFDEVKENKIAALAYVNMNKEKFDEPEEMDREQSEALGLKMSKAYLSSTFNS